MCELYIISIISIISMIAGLVCLGAVIWSISNIRKWYSIADWFDWVLVSCIFISGCYTSYLSFKMFWSLL